MVTGNTLGGRGALTVAHDIVTGSVIWVALYDAGFGVNQGNAIVGALSGARFFVASVSRDAESEDFATIAYEGPTGREVWVARYDGSGLRDGGRALAIHPLGTRLFVAGFSEDAATRADWATLAYATVPWSVAPARGRAAGPPGRS